MPIFDNFNRTIKIPNAPKAVAQFGIFGYAYNAMMILIYTQKGKPENTPLIESIGLINSNFLTADKEIP
ncbi:MAG: hypothetical protein ACYTXI_38100 [Nostoc sp.]